MKQLKYYMMILSALLMLGSCSDDDDPTTGMDARISLSSDVLQVTKEGGTVSVTVTSDADWRLAGVCDWAHPSATEGQSGDVVTFTVDEDDLAFFDPDRHEWVAEPGVFDVYIAAASDDVRGKVSFELK